MLACGGLAAAACVLVVPEGVYSLLYSGQKKCTKTAKEGKNKSLSVD